MCWFRDKTSLINLQVNTSIHNDVLCKSTVVPEIPEGEEKKDDEEGEKENKEGEEGEKPEGEDGEEAEKEETELVSLHLSVYYQHQEIKILPGFVFMIILLIVGNTSWCGIGRIQDTVSVW